MEMEIEELNGFEENGANDSDTCDFNEIKDCFSSCEHVHGQSFGPKYILNISASKEINPNIAVALSDNSIEICNWSSSGLTKVVKYKEHTNKIVECKFVNKDSNLLYTGSNDGTIKLWDLRDSESVSTFQDTTVDESDLIKSISSFDVCPNNQLLAAGTDLTDGDPYILFWDIRNVKLLGAYWESHTDDITQVKFHPNNSNKLISGSTDGLINIYDLSKSCEDDALEDTLNTDAFIENLQWFSENRENKISCVTSTNELQLWSTVDAEPYKLFSRDDISKIIKKKEDNTYIANVHQVGGYLLVLSGSNGSEGKSLRSFQVLGVESCPAFRFDANTQRVRASFLNENTGILLTGGEKGKLDVWKPDLTIFDIKNKKK
ncbi:WD repeat-containing protein 89 [Rhynchophorus ferrugineus]|uniref:WD repeat-containing protein 89 n=1 Tax=Rhynchophorus ferrugineus TaxID=354439 RepID=A0A834M9U8_RHYFE|nr:hypothetical protein GWI33_015310 [Rhynchophorus ferrugineus]